MSKLQFRVLYREFLFRVVDLELLSSHAQGDASKLLGQFAALLIFFGAFFAFSVLSLANGRTPRPELLIAAWSLEHTLIATTMLVVGLFAVLSWDSIFPDRRDVLTLAPLPVFTRTVFLAKLSASATALGLTVLLLNGLTSLAFPLAMAPQGSSILDLVFSPALYRSFLAYAVTMTCAGGFIFGSVLCVQGLAALLLSRRQFLRASAFLQMAAFCLLMSVYFLQPSLTTPKFLAAPANRHALAWLPSYWFLGLLQQLNGSMHPALEPLARRATIGLIAVFLGAAAAYTLSYLHTLRMIVEEPDIAPGSRRGGWLPNFGGSFETAITQFSLRTLLRSRQHRLILAFYFGLGFAITILFLKTPVARQRLMTMSADDPWRQMTGALLASSIVLIGAWIAGIRVVFAMPADLRANWIFRISPIGGIPTCLTARRRALIAMALAPAWLGSAVLFTSIWRWKPAALHVTILGLLGWAVTELCLLGQQKIPFTCSYLPGKSSFHITFWLCIGLLMTLIGKGAEFERRALTDASKFWSVVIALSAIAILARWRSAAAARSEGGGVQFEDDLAPMIIGLGLNRDGALIADPLKD